MRMNLAVILIGALLSIGAAGCANHKGANATAGTADRSRNEYVTGSYIQQDISKTGPVTNGKDDLRIIDRSEIDRSGGADVGETLRRLGANH